MTKGALGWMTAALLMGASGCGVVVIPAITVNGAAADAGAADGGFPDVPTADAPRPCAPFTDDPRDAAVASASAPGCPAWRVANDLERPGYRITALRIAQPAALASPLILFTLNQAIARGGVLWGIRFDLPGRAFRMGSFNLGASCRGDVGFGFADARFRFFDGDAPEDAPSLLDPTSGPLVLAGDRVDAGPGATTVHLVGYSSFGSRMPVTDFPLSGVRLRDVQLTADRGCVGLSLPGGDRHHEGISGWQFSDESDRAYGIIEAYVSVAESRRVNISALSTPLCDVLSGADCARDPQAGWAMQPDAEIDGGPAYRFVAQFTAIAADIRQAP